MIDEFRRHVAMNDTDTAAVIYVGAPSTWAQVGFERLLRSAGRPLETILPRDLHYPAVNMSIDHHRPLRLGDEIIVRTGFIHVGTRSIKSRSEVFAAADGSRACTVTRTSVAVSRRGDEAVAEDWYRRLVVTEEELARVGQEVAR